MRRRMTIRFTGMVQGVGFRYTTQNLAAGFPDITGTVRNVPDGSVELVAEGDDSELACFADRVQDRMAGYIREATRTYSAATGDLAGFQIVR